MLEFLVLAAVGQVATKMPPLFECVEPEGLTAAPIIVEEATDLSEWNELDDTEKKRKGDRSLRVCGAASGCGHIRHCAPFVGGEGMHYQRLGTFHLIPSGNGKARVRFLLQAWNDGAEVGEISKSMGGIQVLVPAAGE